MFEGITNVIDQISNPKNNTFFSGQKNTFSSEEKIDRKTKRG